MDVCFSYLLAYLGVICVFYHNLYVGGHYYLLSFVILHLHTYIYIYILKAIVETRKIKKKFKIDILHRIRDTLKGRETPFQKSVCSYKVYCKIIIL